MKAAGGISALVSAVALLVAPSSSHAQFQFPPSDTTLRCAPAMGGQIEEGVAEAGEPERSSVICFSSTGGPVSYSATTPGHGAVSDAHSARGGFYFVYTATPAHRGPDGWKVIASDGQERRLGRRGLQRRRPGQRGALLPVDSLRRIQP